VNLCDLHTFIYLYISLMKFHMMAQTADLREAYK